MCVYLFIVYLKRSVYIYGFEKGIFCVCVLLNQKNISIMILFWFMLIWSTTLKFVVCAMEVKGDNHNPLCVYVNRNNTIITEIMPSIYVCCVSFASKIIPCLCVERWILWKKRTFHVQKTFFWKFSWREKDNDNNNNKKTWSSTLYVSYNLPFRHTSYWQYNVFYSFSTAYTRKCSIIERE